MSQWFFNLPYVTPFPNWQPKLGLAEDSRTTDFWQGLYSGLQVLDIYDNIYDNIYDLDLVMVHMSRPPR